MFQYVGTVKLPICIVQNQTVRIGMSTQCPSEMKMHWKHLTSTNEWAEAGAYLVLQLHQIM